MDPMPDAGDKNFTDYLNPNSLTVITGCKAEASLEDARVGEHYQFEREGYFTRDNKEQNQLIFNCTIGLRDNWKATHKVGVSNNVSIEVKNKEGELKAIRSLDG
jgi:glutaminyl-tRNA synthetase